MKVYQQGETAVLTCDLTNAAGTATSPDTSMTIVINDPTGAEQQAATAMTQDGTGDYSYKYRIASGAALGVWTYECVSTNAGETTIKGGQFEVVKRIT